MKSPNEETLMELGAAVEGARGVRHEEEEWSLLNVLFWMFIPATALSAVAAIAYDLGTQKVSPCRLPTEFEYSTVEDHGHITCMYRVTRIVEKRKGKKT